MGFLGDFFSSGIEGAAKGIGQLSKDLRQAITGELSEEGKLRLQQLSLEMEELAQRPHLAQAEINKEEAKSSSVFVAGWRPFIGWVLGGSLAAYYLPQYLLGAVLWIKISWGAQALQPYPVSADGLFELILGMLGLGGIRMAEKMKGVDRSKI